MIDLDIVTTPGVAMMVQHLRADAGVIATASHNPIQWNGLKFLNAKRRRPAARKMRSESNSFTPKTAPPGPGGESNSPTKNSETHSLHIKRVLDRVDVLGICSKRFKVVLDSVNGAGCVVTATMLQQTRLPASSPERARLTANFPMSRNRPRRISPACRRVKRQKAEPSASPRTPTPIAWRLSTRTAFTSAKNIRSRWPPSYVLC